MESPAAHALILAAGQGVRFGGAKLLADLRGQPVAAYAARAVAEAIQQRFLGGALAVVAPGSETLSDIFVRARIDLVVNSAPEAGISRSLKQGLDQLQLNPAVGAALIVLADQPLLSPAVIEALVQAWRDGAGTIIRPRYRQASAVPGHPVLIDRRHWGLARTLSGDVGLNAVLTGALVPVLTIDAPGSNPDINTAGDLLSLS